MDGVQQLDCVTNRNCALRNRSENFLPSLEIVDLDLLSRSYFNRAESDYANCLDENQSMVSDNCGFISFHTHWLRNIWKQRKMKMMRKKKF